MSKKLRNSNFLKVENKKNGLAKVQWTFEKKLEFCWLKVKWDMSTSRSIQFFLKHFKKRVKESKCFKVSQDHVSEAQRTIQDALAIWISNFCFLKFCSQVRWDGFGKLISAWKKLIFFSYFYSVFEAVVVGLCTSRAIQHTKHVLS